MFQPAIFILMLVPITMICHSPTVAQTPERERDAEGRPILYLLPERAKETETIEVRLNKQGRRDRMLRNIANPSLTVFRPDHAAEASTAVVICPGGGYSGEAIDKEGYQVAEKLCAAGIAAFVLKYRLPTGIAPAANEDPLPLQDLKRALQLVRGNAEQFHIDAHKVGVMGFSAGGHLAGLLATSTDDAQAHAEFAILAYPVVSMTDGLAHAGSRQQLLGKDASVELKDRYSIEKRVSSRTCPLFIVHAKDDTGVPVKNSMELAGAARQANVPCKLMLIEKGGHGFGIGVHGGEAAGWLDQCLAWMHEMGLAR
jgi:acetyl esterase/lipase